MHFLKQSSLKHDQWYLAQRGVMIIVNLKPAGFRSNQLSQDRSAYFVSGMVNWHITGKPNVWHPPTDVYETEDKIVARIEIAGMHEGDFSVTFDHHILSIGGVRQEISEKRAFHQMEIFFGEFSSEIEILTPVDDANISGEYQDGFLRITLPKSAPKQIIISED
jgi:HSP20 family protein